MSEDTDPGRNREAEIRGGDAPDFSAMEPLEPQPGLVPPDPEPEPEPGPDGG